MQVIPITILRAEFFAEMEEQPKTCRDFDADCRNVGDKLHCYCFDPEQGRCPFLTLPENEFTGA